jgi:hypothetical protein
LFCQSSASVRKRSLWIPIFFAQAPAKQEIYKYTYTVSVGSLSGIFSPDRDDF